MALVTVVEVAGLTGLTPECIRALIEGGRLPAQTVALDHGPVYLVESAAIERITRPTAEPIASPASIDAPRDRLVAALTGLQAALVRRRLLAESETADNEPPRPRAARPRRSISSALSERELRALAARVDRLLGP